MFWTDSTRVINYIKNVDKRFHTFVANRIAAIHDGSSPSQWKYASTGTNPADDALRSLTLDTLVKKNRWVNGPDFLWELEHRWPAQLSAVSEIPENDPEIKIKAKILFTTADAGISSVNRFLWYFSSWSRLKKIIAWILRYREQLRASCKIRNEDLTVESSNVRNIKPIDVNKINRVEKEVLKFVQRQSFGEEISQLEKRE